MDNPLLLDAQVAIASYSSLDTNKVVRGSELGELSFAPLEPKIKRVKELVDQLDPNKIDQLPATRLRQIESITTSLDDALQPILRFNLSVENPSNVRKELISNFENNSNEAIHQLSDILSIYRALNPYLQTEIQSHKLEDLQAELRSELQKVKQHETDLEIIVSAARAATANTGTMAEAQRFRIAADQYERRSKFALITAAVSVLSVAAVLHFMKPLNLSEHTTTIQIIGAYLPYTPLTFGLVTTTIISLKIFTAERHNSIINRHRELALQTFKAFHEGSSTEKIKDAILLQASAAAFGIQPSGYTKAPIDAPQISYAGLKISTEE